MDINFYEFSSVGMSSRKRDSDERNNERRTRRKMKEIIVISDDDSEDGTIVDCPLTKPAFPRHRTTRTPRSSKGVCEMRGCWPFKRKTSIQIGQSSGGGDKMPIPAQHPDPYMPMIMENATTFHGPIIKNPFSYHSIVYRSHPKKSDFIPKINVHCVYRISDRISDLANSYVIPSSLDTSDEPQATYDDQGNFRSAEAVRGSIRGLLLYIFFKYHQ